jgi:hypothetical protein
VSANTSNPAGSPTVHDTTATAPSEKSEFQNFKELAKKVVAVPKKEVDEKRREK